LKGAEQISEVDRAIEKVLDRMEQSSLFNSRLENINLELTKLINVKDQLENKLNDRLRAYDRLIMLPELIKKLISSKYDVDQISSEFASVKLNYDAVCKEIELLNYEEKILLDKKNQFSNGQTELDILVKKKEALLKSFKYPQYRQLSVINLDIYSRERKIKQSNELDKQCVKLIRSIDLVGFAMSDLASAFKWSGVDDPRLVFTYAQRQKIKWIGRKLIEIKIHLEKLINELQVFLPEPEYGKLQFQTSHFVEHYITNIVDNIKAKIFRFQGLDDLMKTLVDLIEQHRENISDKQADLKQEIFDLHEQKKQMVIGL